jgi:pyruvate dehydrogenase E1 component beta subunit
MSEAAQKDDFVIPVSPLFVCKPDIAELTFR